MVRDLRDRALGKYIILEEIGRGGMGAVYKARDVELDRIVAMKVLSPYLVGEPHLVQRFMREARLAANLDHPNIVAIYDIGGEGGYYYFVMKYLEGRPLKEIIAQRGPLPPDEVVNIVRQLASALDYAHQQNLVHRDVKPGNVIIGPDGHATLTDFGLAKVVESMKLTASGETIGTLEYMAPEQARGETSPASDIYSLGVMTYEMLTGRLPFQGTNQATLLYQHLHEPPPPLHRWNPTVPPEVEQVVLRAMAKEPAERYATAGEMARELEQAARRTPFPAPAQRPAEPEKVAPPPSRKPWPALALLLPFLAWIRRRRWAILGGAGALLFLALVLVGAKYAAPAFFGRGPSPTVTSEATAAAIFPAILPHRFLPLASKSPPTPAPAVPLARLALFCHLEEWEGRGHLSYWEWGWQETTPWPGLPNHPVDSQVSWSPDGKWLALVISEAGYPYLYRIHLDGSGLFRLAEAGRVKEDPAWSPDGNSIVYAAGPRQGDRGLFLLPAGGGIAQNLTPGKSDDWAPSWSPDGKYIAFVSNRAGPTNTEIYRLEMAGGQVERLTDSPGEDVFPSWSPDGKFIAFLSNRSGEFRLYRMDTQGGQVEELYAGAVELERPAWSPQGDWLAFTRRVGDTFQVFFLNVETKRLQAGPSDCRRPAWRPQP